MKKLVKSIAVVAMLFVTATGLAKEPKLSLTPNSDKSVNFEMDSATELTSISIVNSNREVIFSEKVTAANIYTKKFDLKNLPEGIYFLEVEDTFKETIFTLSIDESEIKISNSKEISKPVFRKKDGRVFLNLLNLEKEIVKIKVLNSENRVVYQEAILNEMVIEKIFNFKEAFESNYTIIVENNDDRYYETILVD